MPRSLPAEATIAHASAASSASTYDSVSASGDALLFRKIAWRIVPFLFICYIVSILDRTESFVQRGLGGRAADRLFRQRGQFVQESALRGVGRHARPADEA